MNRIIYFLVISFFFSANAIGQDSIKPVSNDSISYSIYKEHTHTELIEILDKQNKSLSEINKKLDKKEDSSSDPIIGYIIAFLGVLISAGVAFKVGTNQGKSNLKIKKIDILTFDKSRLTELKKQIIGRKLDMPINQTITQEQMGSSAIDLIVFRILEVQIISEYFDKEFIQEITEYNNSLQNFMGAAKLGNQINEPEAQTVLSQMKRIEILISDNINAEIKKRQDNIDALL
jgi:hypothetical protein